MSSRTRTTRPGAARRLLAGALPLCLVALTAACGDDGGTTATPATPATTAPTTAPATSAPTTAPPTSGPASPAAGGGKTLQAVVGIDDAFTITLTDGSGAPVTSLPAGTYTVEVNDASAIHNFHLVGPGDVEEETTVPEVTKTTWTVDLVAGEYTFKCDPHPRMIGTFTVT